jgi:hypothetical protein
MSLAACGNGPDTSTAEPSATPVTAAPAPSPSAPATAAARGPEGSTGAALRALRAAARAVPQGRVYDLDAATVTGLRAAGLAARRHPGRLDELELDSTDAGTLVWRADLTGSDKRPTLITLDARTGAIVTTPDD